MKDHLHSRGMHHEDVVVTDKDATFYLWNLSGQMTGFVKYNPTSPKKGGKPSEQKYFMYGHGVWGLQYLNYKRPNLIVTEGIFDAVVAHNYGLNAIAVLSNNPKRLKNWLNTLNFKTTAYCDGDSAGKKLAKYCDNYVVMPNNLDLGNLNEYLSGR